MGLEQVQQALAGLVPPDEQHVRRAVLPAGDRHRVGEPADVDPVGDDLVVAREEAVDEVARRGAHGDPAVQPARVAAQGTAAELVRRREARVGVEGGDVDALRFAQEEERQERHERLVEMQDVELLAVEHRPDLRQVAGREGERPDRRVDRHGEPDAEPDDVAFRRPLRTVAGGQDPDVVPAQAQVFVEEPDVLGDPTVLGVDVRTDETDLHRPTSSRRTGGSNRGGRARPPG